MRSHGIRDSGALFSSHDLGDRLTSIRSEVAAEVDALQSDRLLNTSPTDLVQYLVEKYRLTSPRLRRGEWTVSEVECQIDVRHDPNRYIRDRERPALIPGQRIQIAVPFDGDAGLLRARPSNFTWSPPRAAVQGTDLILVFEIPHDVSDARVREQAEQRINEIEQYLGWIERDVAAFNDALPKHAEAVVDARRNRILANRGRVASLGIPIKRSEDAPKTYVVPDVRRKAIPSLPPAGTAPYVPEPVIGMDVYEHILNVVQNMAHVMERSPSAFREMAEEDLRQHFLVQLNGQFEGAAMAETFNVSGKTDILIRSQGKNVFIAECKFWKGPKHFIEAIDQLLCYTAWRDTKTALLVFVRNTAMTTVMEGIRNSVAAHPRFKRSLPLTYETGVRCVLGRADDPSRELILTVLAFAVPGDEAEGG